MQSSQYPVKIITAGFEVISSGVVHLSEPEVKFVIGNLVFKFRFKTESGDTRFVANVVDNEMVIDLYNFKNALGQGQLKPLEVGRIADRILFITFFVNTIDIDHRQFSYTFMLKECL